MAINLSVELNLKDLSDTDRRLAISEFVSKNVNTIIDKSISDEIGQSMIAELNKHIAMWTTDDFNELIFNIIMNKTSISGLIHNMLPQVIERAIEVKVSLTIASIVRKRVEQSIKSYEEEIDKQVRDKILEEEMKQLVTKKLPPPAPRAEAID